MNTKQLPKLKLWRTIIFEQCEDQMIRILFFAGCASLFISIFDDNWASFYEGISIIFALLFIITLQTICEIVKNN